MCSPDLRDECRAISSGKTLSSFVRSAVHIVDSHRARLPSLFNRRVFPTTPVFRYSCPSFPFVHAPSCAHYAPHLVSLEKSPLVSSRFKQHPLLSSTSIRCLCFINAPLCHSILFPLQHALFRLSSFIRFTPVSSTFSTFRHLASTIARPFLLYGPSLPLSFFLRLKPPRASLFNVTLCAVPSFSNHRSLTLSTTLSTCPASVSLSPSSYLPPTHAHPPPSSSAGSVRIGPAR